MISGASKVNAPPAISSGPRSRSGRPRSAALPPSQLPRAIAARTVPIIPVNASMVTPTYGAINRPARISITRTEADAKKTSARAPASLTGTVEVGWWRWSVMPGMRGW